MKTLNEITEDLLKLNAMLEESIDEHGEIKPEVADELAAWFDQSATERSVKLDAYLGLIREKEMRAVAAKAQKEQWVKKQKSEEAGAEWLKKKLFDHLKLMGETKVVTAEGRTVAIQKNGGKVPVVVDMEAIESASKDTLKEWEACGWIILVPTGNKAEIAAALESGEMVPFAKLGERGESLRIK